MKKNIPGIDYIKLDIEGSELECLRGAAKTITRCKPKMALSAYHETEDMWVLADYLKTLRPDYEFEFRHYGGGVGDKNQLAALKKFDLPAAYATGLEKVLFCR